MCHRYRAAFFYLLLEPRYDRTVAPEDVAEPYRGEPGNGSVRYYRIPWDISAGKVLLGTNLQTVAADWLTLAPRGFCIVEE